LQSFRKKGEGIHHIAFDGNIEEKIRLKKEGFVVLNEP
jgi:4-hydroxyphenylpyruvate dioxygenase-like putative hemolysin